MSSTDEDEFTRHLMGFGLTEKEAQCYHYLLKYGPKTPSPLAKSLHTYREDVYRTLTALIDKGMVRPSLDTPTLYTAVELNTALESALKKHEAELREMEQRKHALEELARQQRFRPSDDVSTFKMLKNIKELVSFAGSIATACKNEVLIVTPLEVIAVASQFGIIDEVKKLIERGATFRMLTDISYSGVEFIKEALAIGEEICHLDGYRGVYFSTIDRKMCFNGINLDIRHLSLSEPIAIMYTDDPTYADYLAYTFELLWQQSVPAEERIQELLEDGPPQVD